MSLIRTALLLCSLGSLCQASGLRTLAEKAQSAMPGKSRVGIVCNYAMNQDQIAELAASMDPGTHFVVADTRTLENMGKACRIMAHQRVDYVLVLPFDPNYATAAPMGKRLVRKLGALGIPCVTSEGL